MSRTAVADLGRALCLVGAGIGVVVLIGWLAGMPELASVVPDQPPMMPNTAVSCILLGVAAAIRRREEIRTSYRLVSIAAAVFVLGIATGTLAEYMIGSDLGIDQAFLRSEVGRFPGRPSPITAAILTLLSVALIFLDVRYAAPAVNWLMLSAGFLAYMAMLGQLFGTDELYRLTSSPAIGVGVASGVSLFLISVGLLFERPEVGALRIATSAGPGGSALRRLTLVSLVSPAILGFLIIRVSLPVVGYEEADLLISAFAVSLTAVSLLSQTVVTGQLEKAHVALETARSQADALFEQAADGVFVADVAGRYTSVNSAGCRLLGRTREEIIGKSILDFVRPVEATRLASERAELMKGKVVVSEWELRHKDGHYVPVEVSSKILPDGRWQGLVRDIAARKEAEASQRRLATVLRYSNDAITVQDLAGNILEWNRGAEQIYGYSESEAKRMNARALVPPEEVAPELTFEGSGAASTEVKRRARNGQQLDVWLTTTPVLNERGEPEAIATFARDVTDRKRLEERLRIAEATSSGIIAVSADAIIGIDEDQRITLFNSGAETMFGYSRDEVLGNPLDLLIPAKDRAIHRRHVAEFATGEDTARHMGERRAEIRGVRKSGEEFPADASISKLRVDGRPILTVALRDISELKRIENDQRFLAEAGLIFSTDLDTEEILTKVARSTVRYLADYCIIDIVEANGEIRRLRVESRDPTKRWVNELLMRISPGDGRHHAIGPAVMGPHPVLIENVSLEDLRSLWDGETHGRALEAAQPRSIISAPLLAHDKVLGAVTLLSSRSGRRYGEAELHLAQDLAHRAAMSIENARLYEAAEKAIRAREDILRIVAHDLRNPLNTIVMQSETVRLLGPDTQQKLPDAMEIILRAAGRMDRLIQDLLEVTRIETGRLSIEKESVPARRMLVESLNVQKTQAEKSGIELAIEGETDLPDILADSHRILQVLENLVGNALKFTPAGGRVTLGAEMHPNEVLFWVRDTGMGIPPENLPHLFDPYWQAETDERGAGLGLAIVKGLVEANGGRVWADSQIGIGSTFFFTVPTAVKATRETA